MFTAWGRIIAGHARLVIVLSMLALVASIGSLLFVSPDLSGEGFSAGDAESVMVDKTLVDEYGESADVLVFLFDAGQPVTAPGVEQSVDASLASVRNDPQFSTVLTTWSTGNPRMISKDGLATYAVAVVAAGTQLPEDAVDPIITTVTDAGTANGLTVSAGGGPAVDVALDREVTEGLVRAETFSIPVTLLIQLVVFGSLIAAGIPLLIAAFGILASIGLIFVLSTEFFQSIFTVNIITLLGLGLGIDYSLFMVTRFREELARRPVGEAITVTMATVGKAILISGVTVIVGLAATQFFPLEALRSMGQSGIVATAMALLFGLTLLPAVLMLLGKRVNGLRVGRGRSQAGSDESPFWHGLATRVMRFPIPVAAAVVIALVLVAAPLLRMDLTPGGPEVLPKGDEARVVSARLASDFAGNDVEPIPVLVRITDGDPTSVAATTALQDLTTRFAAIPNVTGVEGYVSPELATASGFDWTTYDGNPASLPEAISSSIESTVRGDQVLIQVLSNASSAALDEVVTDIRAENLAGTDVRVGGEGANSLDTTDAIYAGLIPAGLFVLIGTYLILLLTFGSILLPIKAILTTLLSISAAMGAVVLVFQDGRLEGLLGFQSSGEIFSTTPILIFCILFGVAMDYEVLMLSRVQEEYKRTGDARASIATGLGRSGRSIAGAAAIVVVVFGGFMLADIVILKELGFGLAIAILIDILLIRGLLVPATMRLLGDWAWWAPAPVKRVVDRLGLGHEEAVPLPAPILAPTSAGAVTD